jgi:hypothetical protein
MMIPLSRILWQSVPPLQLIQFPFRFNAIMTLAFTPLLALSISRISKPYRRSVVVFISVASLVGMIWINDVVKKVWRSYVWPAYYMNTEEVESRNATLRLNIATDFRPKGVAPFGRQRLEMLVQSIGRSSGELNKATVIEGIGTVKVEHWQPRLIMLRTDTETGLQLKISRLFYPGWTAYLSDNGVTLPVQPSDPEGLLDVSVPSGDQQVVIRLDRNPAEQIGLKVSIICALILLLMTVYKIGRHSPWNGSSPEA